MCFRPEAPKAPTVIKQAAAPVAAAPPPVPTQRDATIQAVSERQRNRRRTDQGDASGTLGDPSMAPVTKSSLGG